MPESLLLTLRWTVFSESPFLAWRGPRISLPALLPFCGHKLLSPLRVSLLPLDILQDKDLFSQHTTYFRGFKVSSANKRKRDEKEKNKIMAWLKLPVQRELILPLHSLGLSTSLWVPNLLDFLPLYYVYSDCSILGHLPSCLPTLTSARNDPCQIWLWSKFR